MNIAIVTCHRAFNYGAVLQAYALQKFLKNEGNNVEIIDYFPKNLYDTESNKIIVKMVRPLIRGIDFRKSRKVFESFLKNNMNLTKRYLTIDELKADLPNAELFIVGSDQVWNCNRRIGNDDTYFLAFVPEGLRKISYAASIAMDNLTKNQESRFYKNLKDFDEITVRESSAIKLLNDCGITNAREVVDPVYLLDKKEWDKLESKSSLNLKNEKYILAYGFKRQKNLYEYARKLAKKKGCKLYSINTNLEDYFLDVDKYFWNASPEDWIRLVKNAEAVVTNSFHGLCFSIIYEKEVHQFKKLGTENSRMIDLLNKLKLDNRLVQNDALIENEKDFTKTKTIMKDKIEESKEFLRKQFKEN